MLCHRQDERFKILSHTITNGDGTRFMPFEDDGMLAIILSKALLLADDAAIDDPTIIVRQIKG